MPSQGLTNVANAIINKINNLISSHNSNENAHQDIRESIPSATSELNNNSGFITSSSVPNPSSTTPSADTTNGSVGDGTTWARSNHTHPKSTLYAEANHTHDSMYTAYEMDNLNVDDVHYAAGRLHYESFSNAIYYSDVDEIGFIDKELAVKGDLPTIIDNLTTNDATKVLSAKQGKVLNDMIGDDDISAIGDGSVTGAISSLSTSITNLIQVQEVNRNTPSIKAGGTSKQTFTVTACPTGYTWNYFSTSTGWGTVSNVSLSGTTLTVTLLNVSNGSHNISFRGVLVYYPTIWSI